MSLENLMELSKDQLIARLMEAGWSKADAEKEWEEIQADTEGEP